MKTTEEQKSINAGLVGQLAFKLKVDDPVTEFMLSFLHSIGVLEDRLKYANVNLGASLVRVMKHNTVDTYYGNAEADEVIIVNEVPNEERILKSLMRGQTINPETPQLRSYIYHQLNKYKIRTRDGGRYFTEEADGHFYPEEHFYIDVQRGTHGSIDYIENYSDARGVIELLFGTTKKIKVIEKDNLIKNTIYTNVSQKYTFRFSGAKDNKHRVVKLNMGSIWLRIINNDDLIRKATTEERKHFHREKEYQKELEVKNRREAHEECILLRQERKNFPLRFIKPNNDIKTQLLSNSLCEKLKKINNNPVAESLVRLNSLGYMKDSIRNITIKLDKTMTYCPTGKETELNNDMWVAKGRQMGKYGKVLKNVIKQQAPNLKYKDSDIEQLVNELKASVEEGTFSIVKGEDILDWYNGNKYDCGYDTGTLEHSCMRYNNCREYMRIYSDNPDKVKMVILVKDDLLRGRALLWEDKWMDRIYASDSNIKTFKTFARENGYYTKENQDSSVGDWVSPTGEYYNEQITIFLKTKFNYYPYADTFYYMGDGYVTTHGEERDNELKETDGGLTNDNRVYDEYDARYIQEDDAVFLNHEDYYTHSDNAFYCDVESEWYLADQMVTTYNNLSVWENSDCVVYVSNDDEYAIVEDITMCDHNEEDYIADLNEMVYLDELCMTVHSDNVKDAYESHGYHYQDGEWVETETVKTK